MPTEWSLGPHLGSLSFPACMQARPHPYIPLVRVQTLIPTAADGLHPRYVERGSGELLYSILSTVTRMLRNQSDSRYGVIAYLSYCRELLVIAMVLEDVRRTIK